MPCACLRRLDRFYASFVVFLSEGVWPLDQIRFIRISPIFILPSSADPSGHQGYFFSIYCKILNRKS
jgi:hypothetical protein